MLEPAPWLKRCFPPDRPARRRWVVGGTAGVLALAAAWGARPVWLPRYHQWRAEQYRAGAEARLMEGRREESVLLLHNALRHAAEHPGVWRLYARAARPEDGVEEWLGVLWQAARLNPEDPGVAAAFLTGCLQHGAPVAEEVVSAQLERHGGNADVLYSIAMLRCQAGREAEGRELLRRAVASAPGHGASTFARAVLSLGGSGSAEQDAVAALEGQAGAGAFQVPASLVLGQYWADRRPDRAVECLDRALALAPLHWAARVKRAQLLRERQPERAGELLDDLSRHAASGAQVSDVLALMLVWRGAPAVEDGLRHLPARWHGTPEVGNFEVELLAGQGRWDDVVRVATQRTEGRLSPGEALRFWLWLARGLQEQQDRSTPESVRYPLDRVALLARSSPALAAEAARIVEGWNVLPLTLRFYERLAAEPSSLRNRAVRRWLKWQMDSLDAREALAVADRLAALEPGDADVADLQISLELLTRRSLPATLARAEQQAERHPGSVRARVNLARARTALNRPAEALAALEGLPEDTWTDPVYRLHRAEAWFRAGRVADARREVEGLSGAGWFPGDAEVLRRVREGVGLAP